MNAMMITMARRACCDDSLMASLIEWYGEIQGLQWDEIAEQLWIDGEQLAKLALCRRPSRSDFLEDVARIADHVGIDKRILIYFTRAVERLADRSDSRDLQNLGGF